MSDGGRADRRGEPGGGDQPRNEGRPHGQSAGDRGRRRGRSVHLFGDVYWETRPPLAGVCYALAAVFLFVPRSTFFWTVREPSSWLLVNYPEVFLWLFDHYRAFGVVCLAGAVLAHLSRAPDRAG